MNTMNEMVASMVGGIVMANGGKVEYDIPNTRKRISIVVEDREPTLEERQEDIAKFLTNMGLEQHYPDADEWIGHHWQIGKHASLFCQNETIIES